MSKPGWIGQELSCNTAYNRSRCLAQSLMPVSAAVGEPHSTQSRRSNCLSRLHACRHMPPRLQHYAT
eukprot:351455-Chlamydomonas_euryale.AAC.2